MAVKDVVEKARQAFDEISDYSQEQIDKLVYEVGKIIYQNAEVLAEEAVAETGLGRVDHKIAKNTDTPAGMWDYMKDKKSVGIINEIPESGLIEVAHPVGVIAAVVPATNPTVTTTGNFMHAIKGKNAMIATPAPARSRPSRIRSTSFARPWLKPVLRPIFSRSWRTPPST